MATRATFNSANGRGLTASVGDETNPLGDVPADGPGSSRGSRARPRARHRSPVELSAEVLGGRHTALILWNLFWGAKRFYQIFRDNPGLTRRSLALYLDRLERIGLVERRFPAGEPAAVEYALTPAADTLKPLLGSMYLWGLAVAGAQRSLEDLPLALAREPRKPPSRPTADRGAASSAAAEDPTGPVAVTRLS